MLWRIHIRPSAEDHADPVAVCLDQEVVGVGWGLNEPPASREEYFDRGADKFGSQSWRTALTALIDDVEQDDLVWFRDLEGIYFLGRITDGWDYRDEPENADADLYNVRPAEIYKVERSVPGKLKNCFIPGRTLQPVKSQTVQNFSRLVFNQLSGREDYSVPEIEFGELFDLLDDVELEDVVGLYLQLLEGYALIPSSRESKGTTIAYEYELVSAGTGKRAYVQVKGGNTRLNPEKYGELEGHWYLFSPAGYIGNVVPDNVSPISRSAMEDFVLEYEDLLPISVRAWINFTREAA